MVCYYLKKYIEERYEEEKKRYQADTNGTSFIPFSLPNNWPQILQKYKQIAYDEKVYILFGDFGARPKSLNGSPMLPHGIVLTKEWAFRAVAYDSSDTENAFRISVGHELTHKYKEYLRGFHRGNDRKFIAQTNEVFADFNAAKKMANSSRMALVRSCNYKYNHKISQGLEDSGDFAHPTWQKRKEYAKGYDFNAELIQQIADDIECSNKVLIANVIVFFLKG